ncbi:hypothetical protein GCM10012289_27370 [Nonomuraea cavernae]|uniref:Uncharacterized protein n=1 Tax=Nonomuraea cavernae TaxID=2045107 RepID=A0A918DK20_9ACTN|nr:hypothetical protein GCM10012289_27370 [Nonomuraea cavernae]
MQARGRDGCDLPRALHLPSVVGHDRVESLGSRKRVEALVTRPRPAREIEQMNNLVVHDEGGESSTERLGDILVQ